MATEPSLTIDQAKGDAGITLQTFSERLWGLGGSEGGFCLLISVKAIA